MATIRSLADEFNMQPHELLAFADVKWPYDETAELDTDTEAFIREAMASDPGSQHIDATTENKREERVLDDLHEIAEGAGYDEDTDINREIFGA